MHLKEVKVILDYNNLPNELVIELRDIVPLVGEQGCGKSSLLDALARRDKNFIRIETKAFKMEKR